MADYDALRSSNAAELQIAAVDYFSDPASYAPFDLNDAMRPVVGCIDPRDQAGERVPTVIQTPGGAVGILHDAALVDGIEYNRSVSLQSEVTLFDWQEDHFSTAHDSTCKFLYGQMAILDEQANPGDFSSETIRRWTYHNDLRDVRDYLPVITEAAKRQRDERSLNDAGAEILLEKIREYGGPESVVAMSGANKAVAYIVNHHPYIGLNRQRLHREVQSEAQAYHDNLGAMIAALGAETVRDGYTPEQRGQMLAALLSRSAATRSVIMNANPQLVALEIQTSPRSGIKARKVS